MAFSISATDIFEAWLRLKLDQSFTAKSHWWKIVFFIEVRVLEGKMASIYENVYHITQHVSFAYYAIELYSEPRMLSWRVFSLQKKPRIIFKLE